MVEMALWFAGLGLLVVATQLIAGLHELTLQRRERLQVTEAGYERETLWGALYAWLFHLFYLATLAGFGLFYWELREEVYWKQWTGVVGMGIVMFACILDPRKNIPRKKHYWTLLGWVWATWVALMLFRAAMGTFRPGEAIPFPIP